jgi:hypothetical protein
MSAFQLSHLLGHCCIHTGSPSTDVRDGDDRPRFGRVHLMRHAFRGHKEQLRKLRDWIRGLDRIPTVEEAYPTAGPGKVSAAQVLNAVRFNPTLAEIVTSEQGSDIGFEGGDLVLVFAATGGKTAEYLAAYEVDREKPRMDWAEYTERYGALLRPAPSTMHALGFPSGAMLVEGMGYNSLPSGGDGGVLYNLKRRADVLAGLERRLIVEWKSGVSWLQKDLSKPIIEVRPPGFVREFTGYLDFTLSFDELRAIVGRGDDEDTSSGDPVWCDRLAAVSGVYLVQSDEGPVYVGSAAGRGHHGGFLQRWRTYAATNETWAGPDDTAGLRGNVGMKEFLDAGGDLSLQRKRLHGLRFSIAREMPKNANLAEVLDMESWFKDKLKSRCVAPKLNRN